MMAEGVGPRPKASGLVWLLLIALALRVSAAFWPSIHHPDETLQYLESAWRILGGDGIITWEQRYGMRGWLLPALIAAPMAVGEWLDPGGSLAFFLPRVLAAIASLSIVWSGWTLGARISPTHAWLGGFVAAIWFELVYFAPHTLSESLATAAILAGAVLLTAAAPSRRMLLASGFLLGLGFVLRFQYAPAIAVLVAFGCWRMWRHLPLLIAGGVAALVLGAAADLAGGVTPFAWLVENIHQNLVNDRAAEFGVSPVNAYLGQQLRLWSVLAVPILAALLPGRRHAPVLFYAALANLLFHSLIGHKEYRFVILSVAILVILAALGTGDWVRRLKERGVRHATLVVGALWLTASGALAFHGDMKIFWNEGVGVVRLFDWMRKDPKLCGVGIIEFPVSYTPGLNRLRPGTPLYLDYANDPLRPRRDYSPGYNRILAWSDVPLPSGYATAQCAGVGGGELCILARAGGCDPAIARPIEVNAVLRRLNR